ncbi:MAG: hypothetical protein GY904_20675 [Planctomycetaceae bacterium]|nr:hypothetical protein [Planctomycetaceae bacterium]
MDEAKMKMKYVLLSIAFYFCIHPSCQGEEFSKFGLGKLKPISKSSAEKVRGLGIFAAALSSSGISVNIVDPNTSSKLSSFNSAYNQGLDLKTTSDVSLSPNSLGAAGETNGLAQIQDLSLSISRTLGTKSNVFSVSMNGLSTVTSTYSLAGASQPVFSGTFSSSVGD